MAGKLCFCSIQTWQDIQYTDAPVDHTIWPPTGDGYNNTAVKLWPDIVLLDEKWVDAEVHCRVKPGQVDSCLPIWLKKT